MSHKKKSHFLSHKSFTSSVELLPPQPFFIEFIDAHRLWGFPRHQLDQFVLEDNPQHEPKPASPPQQLMLIYGGTLVFLRGWRLELMLGPLITGRITRIHAEKHLGSLIIEEAWVSEIHVVPLIQYHQPAGQTETPAPIQQP